MGWSEISKVSNINLSTEGIMKSDRGVLGKAWDHFTQMFKDAGGGGFRQIAMGFKNASMNTGVLEEDIKELIAGDRKPKVKLEDSDIAKINKLFPTAGLFNYTLGGDLRDILQFLQLLENMYSPNSPYLYQLGELTAMFGRFGKEQNDQPGLKKNEMIAKFIGRITSREFEIHPNDKNFVTATVSKFFSPSLSISSILKEGTDSNNKTNIQLETDVLKDLPIAKVKPAMAKPMAASLQNIVKILERFGKAAQNVYSAKNIWLDGQLEGIVNNRTNDIKHDVVVGLTSFIGMMTPFVRYYQALMTSVMNFYSDSLTLPNKLHELVNILAPKNKE